MATAPSSPRCGTWPPTPASPATRRRVPPCPSRQPGRAPRPTRCARRWRPKPPRGSACAGPPTRPGCGRRGWPRRAAPTVARRGLQIAPVAPPERGTGGKGLLLVLAEALAQATAGVAQRRREAPGPHRLRQLLETGLTHLAHVALEHEGASQHEQESHEAEEYVGREGDDQHDEAGEKAESGPLGVAPGVAVQRLRADLARELGVVLVERPLDVPEDPLLVLGKRHACPLRRRARPRHCPTPSSRSICPTTTRWPPAGHPWRRTGRRRQPARGRRARRRSRAGDGDPRPRSPGNRRRPPGRGAGG